MNVQAALEELFDRVNRLQDRRFASSFIVFILIAILGVHTFKLEKRVNTLERRLQSMEKLK